MPYLGNEPATAYTSTTKDSFSGDGSTTVFTMSKTAEVNAVRVVVENVIQDPTVAYTCSGTTLTFTSAPPSGTNNIYVVHLGPPAATVAPPTTINSNTTFMDGLTLKNGSPEDTDGGRESIVTFKGLQSGQEESTLAQIQASHDGTADDQKGDLIFRTNDGSDGSSPTERLRIDSAGNVGVGTSTITTSTLGTTNTFFELSGDGGSGTLVLSRDTSTDNAELGGIRFTNRNNADDTNLDADGKLVAAISARVETSDSNAGDDSGAHITFSTKPESGNFTERMRIDSSGSLLLNQTSFNTGLISVAGNASGNKYTIDSSQAAYGSGNISHIRFQNSNGGVGTINTSGSSTSYNTSSDYRLKENVTDVTDGITRIKQLAPKRFNFIADPDTTVDGFLAHEAQTVVPEAVTGTHNEVDDDGNAKMQGIDQAKLVPLLTAALQEAIAKIETLETKVAALEAG